MEEWKGINLNRAVVQADKSGDKAMYRSGVTRREILDGKITARKTATRLVGDRGTPLAIELGGPPLIASVSGWPGRNQP